MRIFSRAGFPVTVAFGLLVAGVLAPGITGCNQEISTEPAKTQTPPTQTVPAGPTPAPSLATPVPIPATATRPSVSEPTQEPTSPLPDGLEPAASFPVPPDRDFYLLAQALLPGTGKVDPVVRHNAPTLEVGHRETLKLVDLHAPLLYESDFELRLVTTNAYWFVEDGLNVSQEDLETSAAEFEDSVYPLVTGAFGTEWKPGVDGDPHLYIINADLRGVGGYYSAADEYPKAIRPVSNEHESIYINTAYLPVGSARYPEVLAHELHHAIHWNADRSEETWINEGLSELAVTIAGYREASVLAFRRAGPTSLTIWPAGDVGGAENYGAASLFMHYFSEHYGRIDDLRPLLAQQGDGIAGLEAYLEESGYEATFAHIFRDWAVANLLDEETGAYGYDDLTVSFPVYRNLKDDGEIKATIPQYSIEYIRLGELSGPSVLSFHGDSSTALLPEDVGAGCWWSNRADVMDSTLTASADLRQVGDASLDYHVWFSIEEDWDFTYLEVSEDGGETWTILETPLTSSDNPLKVSFGPGYTGSSDGWQNESLPLDHWVGQEVLVRFQYITDAAINDHGLCLRDLRVSAQDGALDMQVEWEPNGFAWTNNRVRQGFIIQVVYEGRGGVSNRVVQVPLDGSNRGELTLNPDTSARRTVVIVQAMAPSTRMPARYTLQLGRVN